MLFIAIWIIVAAENGEARPDKKTGRAVHYNGSWSRWRTDRSRSLCQKIHKTIRMYCQEPHPISFMLWKASNPSEERDAVPEREKEWCWQELKKNFTVPAESEEICKRWTMSKMAELLQSFKKILTKKYIKTGTTPVFTGELEKLRGHWDAFVQKSHTIKDWRKRFNAKWP